MNKTLALAFSAALLASPAYANEVEDKCMTYAEENGTDNSGCSCLGETADASAAEEILAVTGPDDLAALSDGAKEAIAACFPEA
ncbi:MAG: hypothetical protein DHS20C05_23250 [Hyphococcus sp.]|nr:MAG: hypothetical protein DHS20C05_23250 [Marinicaulis sp.]